MLDAVAPNGAPVAVDDVLRGEPTAPFRVAHSHDGGYTSSSVAPLADGNFVVAWTGALSPDDAAWDSDAVVARVYSGEGRLLEDFTIAPFTGLYEGYSFTSVAGLANGGFITTWSTRTSFSHNTEEWTGSARVFDRIDEAAEPIAIDVGPIAANTPVSATALDGGGYAIVWVSARDQQDSLKPTIKARVFDADGNAGEAFFVALEPTDGREESPSVIALEGGGFAIRWTERSAENPAKREIKGRIFDANGISGEELVVNHLAPESALFPTEASLDDGRFVVTWSSDDRVTNPESLLVEARIYDADGTPGPDLYVGDGHPGAFALLPTPSVSGLPGGGFVVTWDTPHYLISLSSAGIWARIFDEHGNGGDPILVTKPQQTIDPIVTTLKDGSFVVLWHSDTSITGRLFDQHGEPLRSSPTDEDGVLTFDAADLLANDSDPENHPLAVTAVDATSALGATVTLAGDGTITYDPTGAAALQALRAGRHATDTFVYQVADGNGGTATATVTLKVAGLNDAPVPKNPLDDQTLPVTVGEPLRLTLPAGIFEDADTGDTLALSASLADGTRLPRWICLSEEAPCTTPFTLDDASAEPLEIRITGTDASGASASTVFTLSLAVVNGAPRVSLANVVSQLPENADTSSPVKVADIVVEDDGVGENHLSLSGKDAAAFEVVGNALFLRAGTPLAAGDDGLMEVVVEVDDPAVRGAPDDAAPVAIAIVAVDDTATGGEPEVPTNAAPAVELALTLLPGLADADTSSRPRVAVIRIVDDGRGDNVLSLSGADRELFEVVGDALFLRAGATPDFGDDGLIEVIVEVDDPAVGTTPDDAARLLFAEPATGGGLPQPDDGGILPGSDGNDAGEPAPGGDHRVLGGGAEVIHVTPAEIDGTTISGFGTDDALILTQGRFGRADITVSDGSAILSIDTDRDGLPDTTVTFEGDFSAGDFMAVRSGGATGITFAAFLPALSDGSAVDPALVNGIFNQEFLNGDHASAFAIELADLGFAAYSNVLGAYEIARDGTIVDVTILCLDTNGDERGTWTLASVEPGHDVGFFIVQDGADAIAGFGEIESVAFVGPDGARASIDGGAAVRLLVDGAAVAAPVFHSVSPTLNPDGLQHAISGVEAGGESIIVGFEDMTGGGDRDYEDVVFRVSALDEPFT